MIIIMIPPNIVIDKFTWKGPHEKPYTYFLSHWHSDHYQGITQNWSNGPIVCSNITKQLLLTKYPNLKDKVIGLQLKKWYSYDSFSQSIEELEENRQMKKEIKIMLMDSNHIAGSVMILLIDNLSGKNYLHTGDLRFNQKVAQNNPILFQKVGQHQSNYRSRFIIHQLLLDNTYCDPIFKFPPRSKALKMITQIIHLHPGRRIFLCTDTIGKEESFIILSQKYHTPIVLNQERYQYCKAIGIIYPLFNTDSYNFTLNRSDGWIEVIKKSEREQRMKDEPMSVSILMTGWCNINEYQRIGFNYYVVPYSLHSNFEQIQMLVKWIRPMMITPIVQHSGKSQKFRQNSRNFESYFYSLSYMKQRGLDYLIKQYCSFETKSIGYQQQLNLDQ